MVILSLMGNLVKSETPYLLSTILLGDFSPVGAGSPVFRLCFEDIAKPALTMF
ncbi:MAG: hypothetical protein RLZZ338_1350 [Cyanobacteriota bacterium]|jgi:hypothetical protein